MVAGLSSSAAFEVSVAGAMAAPDDLSFDHEPVSLCWEAETEFVGVDCGIVDQCASVQTEPESALFPDCRSETHEDVPLPTGELGVVATDTTVCRGLIDSADDDRVATRREGVEYFDDALDVDVDSLRDVDVASFDAHERDLPWTVHKRVRHVVTRTLGSGRPQPPSSRGTSSRRRRRASRCCRSVEVRSGFRQWWGIRSS